MSIECQSCKEPDMKEVGGYPETDALGRQIIWVEYVCDNCGAYCQMSRVDLDHDPLGEGR